MVAGISSLTGGGTCRILGGAAGLSGRAPRPGGDRPRGHWAGSSFVLGTTARFRMACGCGTRMGANTHPSTIRAPTGERAGTDADAQSRAALLTRCVGSRRCVVGEGVDSAVVMTSLRRRESVCETAAT